MLNKQDLKSIHFSKTPISDERAALLAGFILEIRMLLDRKNLISKWKLNELLEQYRIEGVSTDFPPQLNIGTLQEAKNTGYASSVTIQAMANALLGDSYD